MFKEMLTSKVKLVSMVYTSNLDGYTIPAEEIIKVSHAQGAKVMLDGAQSAPHKHIDVQKLDVDFFAFSIHKMCGPTGMGILYGKEELLENLEPFVVGGDTVTDTFYNRYPIYLESPAKFEAGLQNYAGIIGAGVAVEYLRNIGLDNITRHEFELNKYLTENLSPYEELEIIGPKDPELRGGIFTFFAKKKGLSVITGECDKRNNIMLRSGEFCIHSWFNGKGVDRGSGIGIIRASLYFYNTLEECEIFISTIKEILQEFKSLPIIKVYKHG
jgi:cysteine desulfurase/selenocysteine lyase